MTAAVAQGGAVGAARPARCSQPWVQSHPLAQLSNAQACCLPLKRHGQRRLQWLAPAAAAAGGTPLAGPQRAGFLSNFPHTARVALRTGVYIAGLGLAVLVAPAASFGLLFDSSAVPAGWVRVGGVLAALYGFYYVGAALDDAEGRYPRRFYSFTVAGRLALSAVFAALVATRQCEPALLWLAAANAASSALLWRAVARRAAADREA